MNNRVVLGQDYTVVPATSPDVSVDLDTFARCMEINYSLRLGIPEDELEVKIIGVSGWRKCSNLKAMEIKDIIRLWFEEDCDKSEYTGNRKIFFTIFWDVSRLGIINICKYATLKQLPTARRQRPFSELPAALSAFTKSEKYRKIVEDDSCDDSWTIGG